MARPKLNTVVLDFVGGAGTSIVNIPKALSLVNRKSFRQGYVYSVDFIEVIADSPNQFFAVAKLPENYNTLAAYRLGFHNWKSQRADASGETGVEPGKWSDFKPYYNESHYLDDGTLVELQPRGFDSIGLVLQELDRTGSEWNMADMVVHDVTAPGTTTNFAVGMLGDDNLAAAPGPYGSLINAWGDMRAAVMSPDPLMPVVASESWIGKTGAMNADMSQNIIGLIEEENDKPPYANQVDTALPPTYVGNLQSAPWGMMVDKTTTGATGRPVSMDGGLFPLGYLLVNNAGETPFVLRVHCTRGEYKGVAALPMGDFS